MTQPPTSGRGSKVQGRVELRGGLRGRSTTDQRLLDNKGAADWLHTDPWRVLRIQSEFVDGFGAMAELGPAVSIFGSARLQPVEVHPWPWLVRPAPASVGSYTAWRRDLKI